MNDLLGKDIELGRWFGLRLSVSPVAILAFAVLGMVCTVLAAVWLKLGLLESLQAGLWSALVFFISDLAHQWGHARAAQATGYPMTGIRFHSLFSASQYPPDEPPLPPQIHIRRALGGFWVNLLIGVSLAPFAGLMMLASGGGGAARWVLPFVMFTNVFVLGLGALLPIDIPGVFTVDGGTILRAWLEMRRK